MSIARHAASGRLAHQRCNVEGCPCRIDFSRAECLLSSATGKSTSANRLHSLGIMFLFAILDVNRRNLVTKMPVDPTQECMEQLPSVGGLCF